MIYEKLDNEEEIEVLCNDWFGSWKISHIAEELYILRKKENKINDNKYFRRRNDPILIQIYNELGEKFDGTNSKTTIHKIPKKYENYYYIDKYDDLESVEIDYTKYQYDNLKKNIKEILENNNIDNNEKINEIKKIVI
jgi:uncharacterized protein YcgL (UPF0745 family)